MKKLLLLLTLVTIVACGQNKQNSDAIVSKKMMDNKDNNVSKKVLIVESKKTPFKEKLVNQLESELSERKHSVKKIMNTDYEMSMENDYDVVLMVEWLLNMQVSKTARKSIKETSNTNKYIMFVSNTTGQLPKELRRGTVDGIASASKIKKIDSLTDELVYKIEKNRSLE